MSGMPIFPVPRLVKLSDPAKTFTDILRERLVELGIVPSGEHVIYGPGRSDENDPQAPRIHVDVDDSFTVTQPSPGATNYGDNIRETLEGENEDGPVSYEERSSSIATINERLIITGLARIPEDGEDDPVDMSGDTAALIYRRAQFELRSRVISCVTEILNLSIPKSGMIGKNIKGAEGASQYGAAFTLVVPFTTEVPTMRALVLVRAGIPADAKVTLETPEGDVEMANVRMNY